MELVVAGLIALGVIGAIAEACSSVENDPYN